MPTSVQRNFRSVSVLNDKDERRRNLFATHNNNIKQLVVGCQKSKKPSMLPTTLLTHKKRPKQTEKNEIRNIANSHKRD